MTVSRLLVLKRSDGMGADELAVIGKAKIFAGLNDEQREAVAALAVRREIDTGEFILREYESVNTHLIFVIATGKAEVLKDVGSSGGTARSVRIATIGVGDVVGDMSIVDKAPRSATVRALEPTTLLTLDMDRVRSELADLGVYPVVASNILAEVCRRMRENHTLTVSALNREIEASRVRVSSGMFVMGIIFLISCYTLALEPLLGLKRLNDGDGVAIITISFILIVSLGSAVAVMLSGYPLSDYGLTTRNAGTYAWQGALWSVPILAGCTALKWLLIQGRPGASIFTPIVEFGVLPRYTPPFVYVNLILYILFAPLQEFTVRGALQSALHRLLGAATRKQIWSAIVLSNLLFSAGHSHIGIGFALAALIPGLFWGWMFYRQRSLVGPSVSHILIGTYVIFVLGLDQALLSLGRGE